MNSWKPQSCRSGLPIFITYHLGLLLCNTAIIFAVSVRLSYLPQICISDFMAKISVLSILRFFWVWCDHLVSYVICFRCVFYRYICIYGIFKTQCVCYIAIVGFTFYSVWIWLFVIIISINQIYVFSIAILIISMLLGLIGFILLSTTYIFQWFIILIRGCRWCVYLPEWANYRIGPERTVFFLLPANFCRRHYKVKFDIDPGYIF